MLNTVYRVYDRRHRPLRNSVYLAFPKRNVAFARVSETAFDLVKPCLSSLAGVSPAGCQNDAVSKCGRLSENLFNGNVQILTARELKKRHPSMPVIAIVENPFSRLGASFERLILSDRPLPSFYIEAKFSKSMSLAEYVTRVAEIPDFAADNQLRSQTSILTHKGQLVPSRVYNLEDVTGGEADFLASICGLEPAEYPATWYRDSNGQSSARPPAYFDHRLARIVRRRYKMDFTNFYSGPAHQKNASQTSNENTVNTALGL